MGFLRHRSLSTSLPSEADDWAIAIASIEILCLLLITLVGIVIFYMRRDTALLAVRKSPLLAISVVGSLATMYAPIRTIMGWKSYECAAMIVLFHFSCMCILGPQVVNAVTLRTRIIKQQLLGAALLQSESYPADSYQKEKRFSIAESLGPAVTDFSSRTAIRPDRAHQSSVATDDAAAVDIDSPDLKGLDNPIDDPHLHQNMTDNDLDPCHRPPDGLKSIPSRSILKSKSARNIPSLATELAASQTQQNHNDTHKQQRGDASPTSGVAAASQESRVFSRPKRGLSSARDSIAGLRQAKSARDVFHKATDPLTPNSTNHTNITNHTNYTGRENSIAGVSPVIDAGSGPSAQLYRPTSARSVHQQHTPQIQQQTMQQQHNSGARHTSRSSRGDETPGGYHSARDNPVARVEDTVIPTPLQLDVDTANTTANANATANDIIAAHLNTAQGGVDVLSPRAQHTHAQQKRGSLSPLGLFCYVSTIWIVAMLTCLLQLFIEDPNVSTCERSWKQVLINAVFVALFFAVFATVLYRLPRSSKDGFRLRSELKYSTICSVGMICVYFAAYIGYLVDANQYYVIDSCITALGILNLLVVLIAPGIQAMNPAWSSDHDVEPAAATDVDNSGCCSKFFSCRPVGAQASAPAAANASTASTSSTFSRAKIRSSIVVAETRSSRHLLDEILRDMLGTRLFAAYLQGEYQCEALLFLLETHKFKLVMSKQAEAITHALEPMFVEKSARRPVSRSPPPVPRLLPNADTERDRTFSGSTYMSHTPKHQSKVWYSPLQFAERLYATYMAPDAPFPVRVSAATVREIQKALDLAREAQSDHGSKSVSEVANARAFTMMAENVPNNVLLEGQHVHGDLFEQARAEMHHVVSREAFSRFIHTPAFLLWSEKRPQASKGLHRKEKSSNTLLQVGSRRKMLEESPGGQYKKASVVPI